LLEQRRSNLSRAGIAASIVLAAGSILLTSGQAQPAGQKGKELFERRCGGCHALDRDKEGPRLGNVYGRAAASVASFEYSAALQKSKIKWTNETLDKWLIDPEKLVPKTDMSFHVESPVERHEIISYLEQNSGK
jgi:cytochrome c